MSKYDCVGAKFGTDYSVSAGNIFAAMARKRKS